MKNYFKNTWYMYVICFVFCFMLFLYEPSMLFLNNVADFYFGFSTMFTMSIMLFFLVFIPIVLIFNIVYFLDKKKKIFNLLVLILFIIFVCTYIQGNYLVGNLPVLDGNTIIWSEYKTDWIISFILWGIVIAGMIFLVKKLKLKNLLSYFGYFAILIFIMLNVSFITTYFSSSESLEKDFSPLVTYKNISNYSSNKNFIILLLDCADSTTFNNRLNAYDDFKDVLKDFTYYPDTMSGHVYTLESLPLILTGEYYHNEEPISTWSTKAYKKSYLFDLVEKNNYDLSVYSNNMLYYDKSATRVSNVADNNDYPINKIKFWKNEIKYILFKYLPSYFKQYSKINEMHFTAEYINGYTSNNDRPYSFFNDKFLDILQEDKIKKVDGNVFKFIHLKGPHSPYIYNKDYKEIKNDTYEDEMDSSITLIKEYLNSLKENGMYDNSAIIIMSDHGYHLEANNYQRQNPILFVKGFNETHKKMNSSDKPVHFNDLKDLYKDLLAGKKTNELFKNISVGRTRSFLSYKLDGKDYMVEYETNGSVLDKSKIHKTGKEYRIKE